jgi:hypothetical protein
MPEEKANMPFRVRPSMRRALMELAELQGGIARDDLIRQLLAEGLAAARARLGIERDPAAMAAELLRTLLGVWDGELSDEEIQAFGITCTALDRITQVRARGD